MRLNKYIALHTNLSRRAADEAIKQNRILVNGQKPTIGQQIGPDDIVLFDDACLNDHNKPETVTIILNKPVSYVCSKDGQGSKTVYDLLPKKYANLNTVGRLDKDSSGLILLTNDGNLHNKLTHPSSNKEKIYNITLNKPLQILDEQQIVKGVKLEDGISKLYLKINSKDRIKWQVKMYEGRNRQIRRTFNELGYKVTSLHRIKIDKYQINKLLPGKYLLLN